MLSTVEIPANTHIQTMLTCMQTILVTMLYYSTKECAIRHINPGFLHSPSNKAFGETARSKHTYTLSYWDAKVIVQILPPCQSVSVTSHKRRSPPTVSAITYPD